MRSFRFTSDGTTGDNSTQQQRISCDIKMTPVSNTESNDQASVCNCYTEDTCEPWTFTPGSCTTSDSFNGVNDRSPDLDCDNGLNLCDAQSVPGSRQYEGQCISCQNLKTVEACQDRVWEILAKFYCAWRRFHRWNVLVRT